MGEEERGDDGMVMGCTEHPSKKNPGGICAFCLQEKLGKLVSSSSPMPANGSTSFSSSSATFGSEFSYGSSGSRMGSTESTIVSLSARFESKKGWCQGGKNLRHHQASSRAHTLPFLLAKKKKRVEVGGLSPSSSSSDLNAALARSKSTVVGDRTAARTRSNFADVLSPRKRTGLWSLLHFYSSKSAARKRSSDASASRTEAAATSPIETCLGSSLLKKGDITVVVEEEEEKEQVEEEHSSSPPPPPPSSSSSSLDQKVSRSRSTGCGNRSFSGDFFDRFSNGFGDCTLRRVESHREGNPKSKPKTTKPKREQKQEVNPKQKEKEKEKAKPTPKLKQKQKSLPTGPNSKQGVKCGGLFRGFAMASSSSSTAATSSSLFWISSAADEKNAKPANGKSSRGWSWAFASPMRAFSRASSKGGHRSAIRESSRNNVTANLSAIPSLLIA